MSTAVNVIRLAKAPWENDQEDDGVVKLETAPWESKPASPTPATTGDFGWTLKPRPSRGLLEPLHRIGGAIVGDIRAGDTAIGRALGFDTDVDQTEAAPFLNFGNLGLEDVFSPIKDTGIGKAARGVVTGAQDFFTGLTTPTNALIMAGTGGVGAIAKKLGQTFVSKAISAGFSVDMLNNAYKMTPEFTQAVNDGDTEKAFKVLTEILGSTAMAATAARHASEGTGGRFDPSRLPSVKESRRGIAESKRQAEAYKENKIYDEWMRTTTQPEVVGAPVPPSPPRPTPATLPVETLLKQRENEALMSQLGLAVPKPRQTQQQRSVDIETGTESNRLLPTGLSRTKRTVPSTKPPVTEGGFFDRPDLRPPVVPVSESPLASIVLPDRFRAPIEPPAPVEPRPRLDYRWNPMQDPAPAPRPSPGAPLTERQAQAFEAFTDPSRPIFPRELAWMDTPEGKAEALGAAESISKPTGIAAEPPTTTSSPFADILLPARLRGQAPRTQPSTPGTKSAADSAKVFQRAAANGDGIVLSAFGVGYLDAAANRAWKAIKGKFAPAVGTELVNGKPDFLQQAAMDRAAEVEAAKKNKRTVFSATAPVNASAWQRGMWTVNRIIQSGGVHLDNAQRQGRVIYDASGKAGETYKGEEAFESRVDMALNSVPTAVQKLISVGYNRINEELSERTGHEASEYILAPQLKTLETRSAGKRVFEAALDDKTSPLHAEAKSLNTAYADAQEAYQKVRDGKAEAQEATVLADALHESKAALDQWMIDKGTSFWDTLKQTGAKGPRTGRTAAEIDGYMTDPRFQVYEPYKKIVRDAYDLFEQDAVDSGMISPELMEKMKSMYPDYVRISRIIDDGMYGVRSSGSAGKGRSVGHLSEQTQFKKFKGGNQPIQDAFTSLFEKAMSVTFEANRNRLGRQLADYLTVKKPDRTVGREVWKDVMRLVPAQEIKSGKFTPNEMNSISYLDNGRKQYIEIADPLLVKGLRNLEPAKVTPWLIASARLARIGMTGINMEFFSRNLPVDFEHSLHTTPHIRKSLYAIPSAFKQAILGKGEDRSTMTMFGSGFNENILYQSPSEFASSMAHVFSNPGRAFRSALEFPSELARDPIGVGGRAVVNLPGNTLKTGAQAVKVLETALIKTEEFGRLRGFISVKELLMEPGGGNSKFGRGKLGGTSLAERYSLDPADVAKGLSEADASAIAAVEANNILPPYHRSGLSLRWLGRIAPYFNAGIKATTSTLRRAYDNPAKFAATWIVSIGVPTVAATAWNLQDERIAALNFELSEFDKERSLIRMLPRPLEGESYQDYKRRVTKSQDKYKTYNFPLAPGLIGQMQILLRRVIEDEYRKDPIDTRDKINKFLDAPSPNEDDQEVGGIPAPPDIRPLTASEVKNRVGSSVLPFEPSFRGLGAAVTPPLFRGPAENELNVDFHTGRPIVSPNLERLSGVPEAQTTTGRPTSPLLTDAASWIAANAPEAMNLSKIAPQHLENLIVKQLGTTGRHVINIADAIYGVPQESRGGRDPFTGIADIFASSIGGEQRRIAADTKDKEEVKDKRIFHLSIPKTQRDFLSAAGYTPSLPKRKVVTEDEKVRTSSGASRTVTRTRYTEPDDVYEARLKARAAMISHVTRELMRRVNKKKWEEMDRNRKQEDIFQPLVRAIDEELDDLYDPSLTDAERLSALNSYAADLPTTSAVQ